MLYINFFKILKNQKNYKKKLKLALKIAKYL